MNKKSSQDKIQELQAIEANLQLFNHQKQMLELELGEVENALEEIKNVTDDEIYKILSGIMIKIKKESAKKELEEKKKEIGIRLTPIEKQFKALEENANALRKEVIASNKEKENK